MKTSLIKSNGVRDGTEERIAANYSVEYAKRLVDKEKTEREKADNEHASEHATGTKYGHVKLSDDINSTSAADNFAAATPYAVKQAYDKATDVAGIAAKVQSDIDKEKTERKSEAATLRQKITDEENARITADDSLSDRTAVLENEAHTHTNKSVLDGITAERVNEWDGITEQVTQTQLDGVRAFFEEICFGLVREFSNVWRAIGVNVYDGGMFGMAQTDDPLDGGGFDDTNLTSLDCGGFEPFMITAEVGAVIDGGNY